MPDMVKMAVMAELSGSDWCALFPTVQQHAFQELVDEVARLEEDLADRTEAARDLWKDIQGGRVFDSQAFADYQEHYPWLEDG